MAEQPPSEAMLLRWRRRLAAGRPQGMRPTPWGGLFQEIPGHLALRLLLQTRLMLAFVGFFPRDLPQFPYCFVPLMPWMWLAR